jgi:hypothetical protein
MSRAKFFFLVRLSLTATALAALPGCNNQAANQAHVEKPIPVSTPQPSPAVSATPVPKLPPPTQAEVEAALHRVFGDNLVAITSKSPFFIVGDFNGDESEDVALIARPAPGKLQDVNSELSNWTIQDADRALGPMDKKVVIAAKEERPAVAKGEEVLAIIHGVGAKGWRDSDARQAYIVKHAAATLLGTAPSISQKAIRIMHLPFPTDIIKQVRNNKKGFLFWTGGVYAWHPSEG